MRHCNICKKPMMKGYCIDNGQEYYCSKKCLNTKYSDKEWGEMYNYGNGDSYYTEWENDGGGDTED